MEYLDTLPIWAFFVGMIIVVLATAEIGFRIGIRLQDRSSSPGDSRMTGAVVGGMLGLVGFLMAFSIGITIGNHSERKTMVITEANTIGVAWLRAGFLDEPDSVSLRKLLREYAEVRLDAANEVISLQDAVSRSEQLYGEMWIIIERGVKQGNDSDIMVSLVEAVNDVIKTHSLRITAAHKRLPRILGLVLIMSTILSFLLVGVASSADRKRDTAAIILFALVFTSVLMIMIDLDRPQEGTLTVSQTAMEAMLRQIEPLGQ
ncbi:MAG: hypothetical protein WBN06_00325 [Lysobacterales bacterium]